MCAYTFPSKIHLQLNFQRPFPLDQVYSVTMLYKAPEGHVVRQTRPVLVQDCMGKMLPFRLTLSIKCGIIF
jgi:hypothetical protein